MCLEDVAIGMATWVGQVTATIGVGGGNVVAANPKRTLLIIGAPESNTIWFSFKKDTGAGHGFSMTVGSTPMVFDIQRHGNLCQLELNAVAIGANGTFSVIVGELDLARLREFKHKLGIG